MKKSKKNHLHDFLELLFSRTKFSTRKPFSRILEFSKFNKSPFQKFFRLEFLSANWHGEFKKSEIWHEGSLRCYPEGTILLFAISGIFMEFWGIFGEYPPIFDILVERAPVKLGFECFLSEYGLGGRPRHYTTRT